MKSWRAISKVGLVGAIILSQGCATKHPFDYTALRESKPRSILIIPPLNNSPDVTATNSVLAQATLPLSESGYYVFPVSLVSETFKQNGLTHPGEMHAVANTKLREIFGADSALYITIQKFGPVYTVINSETLVVMQGRLVDLRTGRLLWVGSAQASSREGEQQQGGLAALLVTAIVKQVLASTFDVSHRYAGIAANRLLTAGQPNGLLSGPRSPNYGKDRQ
jgi:hypothetical protein